LIAVCSAPEAGEYGLEICVNDPDADGSSLYHVCQYMIVCSELVGGGATRALPRLPAGFLGPQPNFRKFGLECASHDDPYITTTSGELEVSHWWVTAGECSGASIVTERSCRSDLDRSRQLQQRSRSFSGPFAPRAFS